MARILGPVRRFALLALALAASLAGSACSRHNPTAAQADVQHAFDAWKSAVINRQTDQALAYIPRYIDAYLAALNSPPPQPPVPLTADPFYKQRGQGLSAWPSVDLLLRTALEKKVPPDLRPHLTLKSLLQRVSDRHLFKTSDVEQITLGRVTVTGEHASAEVYYQGTLTALRLPFVNEDHVWKIDVIAILPYAEVLMRLDRAVKGETEAQQVDQLVAKLPSL